VCSPRQILISKQYGQVPAKCPLLRGELNLEIARNLESEVCVRAVEAGILRVMSVAQELRQDLYRMRSVKVISFS